MSLSMLLDHFHPPLSEKRDWHGFHHAWATYLSADLNSRLPESWFAQPHVEFGVEIDVAALEEASGTQSLSIEDGTQNFSDWTPPAPALTISLPVVADVVEVQVFRQRDSRVLVGAIELLSPANKDRPETREAFTAKCEALLCDGVGLVVVDVVTSRHANLHEDLLNRLGTMIDDGVNEVLYAASYHPLLRDDTSSVDIWHDELQVGQTLPTMPLFLKGGPCMPLDLQESYTRTCKEQKIPRES